MNFTVLAVSTVMSSISVLIYSYFIDYWRVLFFFQILTCVLVSIALPNESTITMSSIYASLATHFGYIAPVVTVWGSRKLGVIIQTRQVWKVLNGTSA